MIQDLVNRGGFVEGFNGLDIDTGQSRQLLYAGKAAMELMGSWNLSTMRAENPEWVEANLDFFPFPAVEGGEGDPSNVVGTIGDNFYSISSVCPYPEEAFKMIQYLIDDASVAERGPAGRIPPVVGFSTEDPKQQALIDLIGNASSVQLWYDQYLPPELGEVHKDTMQALFGLEPRPKRLRLLTKRPPSSSTANSIDSFLKLGMQRLHPQLCQTPPPRGTPWLPPYTTVPRPASLHTGGGASTSTLSQPCSFCCPPSPF